MKNLVIYHHNCADGFTAAWAIWKKHPDWTFYGGVHGQEPPFDLIDKSTVVYLVDFSYKRDKMLLIADSAAEVIVLDHHDSAEAEVSDLLADDGRFHGEFDMERSGARLAWDWFHPGEEPPRLLLHVEDRDLWRFALPGTAEIKMALFSFHYDFEQWDVLMETPTEHLQREGEVLVRKHSKDIDEFIGGPPWSKEGPSENVRFIMLDGCLVPAVNLPYFYVSEAGNKLAKWAPFGVCYWDTGTKRMFSLRSDKDRATAVDVSKVAQKYGGGGHKNAAGFPAPAGWLGDETSEDPQHLMIEIAAWARETFGSGRQRVQGCLHHLRDEVDELIADPTDPMEWADLFILAMQGADDVGFTFRRLMAAVRQKHEINKQRKWGEKDERGVVKHVPETEGG